MQSDKQMEKLEPIIRQKLATVGINQSRLTEILACIEENNCLSKSRLISITGLPESVIRLLGTEFSDYLAINQGSVSLSESGKSLLSKLEKINQDSMPFETLTKFIEGCRGLRSQPKRSYDQFFATAETTAKRAITMLENGDLAGRKILFIGDDDLTSIACAYFKQASEITVVDIDKDILSTITKIKQTGKMQIRTLYYDAKSPLPKELYGKYDTCFFDPPYTPTGLRLFLSRAVEALKKDGRIYICYGYSMRSKERGFSAQEVIHRSGLLIDEKIPDFNQYQKGAESIGNRSSLYICSTTFQTRPMTEDQFKGPIYTGRKF
jgi:predicted methyltransferase